ncbi:hypothetical protein DC31_16490 [Microbacterium sp. CH12i]|uniref:hypothetical protein n=1 Tax=Microbacterium sp. CH12i TaxID=1479651 RepID=UPI0004612D4F|nr:hypothetical protein [Microbacterium sp. CH12i]KDA05377.1 hypothetical protein DC31_16490 [Microbacterium sp. CH12i]
MAMTWWRTDAAPWRAHGWSIEVRGDELADIRRDGRLVLRGVRAVVRDHGWNTVPVVVESFTTSPDGLEFRLRHDGLGARVAALLRVDVRGDELIVSWDAVNEVGFDTCRAGLVVLHPATDAGSAVTVTHSDGSAEQTMLPVAISPHQPTRDIRELRIGSTASINLRFDGEVFEMEDQRNWSDASFKTYSRPLSLPYPYRLEAGEHLRQSISVRVDAVATTGTAPATGTAAGADPVIHLNPAGAFPQIGIEACTAPDPVPAVATGAFRVVELNLTTPNWHAALTRASADKRPIDVRLVTDGDAGLLEEAARSLRDHDVQRVTPFDVTTHVSDRAVVEATRAALASAGLCVPILAGARSHFTELNREQHQVPHDVHGIAVNTTPLFHSLDTEQLVEAIPMQRLIAEQTVRIADGLPVHIGPLSLRPRFNNVATSPEPAPTRDELSEGYGAQFTGGADERQRAAELAAWVVASAAALAVPGVVSLSWFEAFGPRGLRDANGAFPVAAAIESLSALAGGTLLTGSSPDGLVWAIGSRSSHEDIVLVANLDRVTRKFGVQVTGGATQDVVVEPGSWTRMSAAR